MDVESPKTIDEAIDRASAALSIQLAAMEQAIERRIVQADAAFAARIAQMDTLLQQRAGQLMQSIEGLRITVTAKGG